MRLNKKVSIFTPKLHVFLLHILLNDFSINTLAADLYPLSEKNLDGQAGSYSSVHVKNAYLRHT